MKDNYEILGVSKDANFSELRRAYRKKAFKVHPDRNPDDPNAGAKFRSLTDAFKELLKNRSRELFHDGEKFTITKSPPAERRQTDFVEQHKFVETPVGDFFTLTIPYSEEEDPKLWNIMVDEGIEKINFDHRNDHLIYVLRGNVLGDYTVTFVHPVYDSRVFFVNVTHDLDLDNKKEKLPPPPETPKLLSCNSNKYEKEFKENKKFVTGIRSSLRNILGPKYGSD